MQHWYLINLWIEEKQMWLRQIHSENSCVQNIEEKKLIYGVVNPRPKEMGWKLYLQESTFSNFFVNIQTFFDIFV